MPKRKVLVLQKKESPWVPFLEEFFEDTKAELTCVHDPAEAAPALDHGQDLVFADPELLTLPLSQKLKVLRQSRPGFRFFRLGPDSPSSRGDGLVFDAAFDEPSSEPFQKQLVAKLAFPDKLRVLIVDDEREIGNMLRDYLEGRAQPSFEVRYEENGEKGLRSLEAGLPDLLILDIKMPVMDGREVYREVIQRGYQIPVIVFFDAISGDEMIEIHKYGRPVVVEKGARRSDMSEMLGLIKKMAYFG